MQTAVTGWVFGLCWNCGWSLRRGAGQWWSHTEMLSSLEGQSQDKLCPGWRSKQIIYWTRSLKQLHHIKVITPWRWARYNEDIPGAEDELTQLRVSLPQTPAQRGSLGTFPVSQPLWKLIEGRVYIHKTHHHLMFSPGLCRLGLSVWHLFTGKRVLSEGHFSQPFVCA